MASRPGDVLPDSTAQAQTVRFERVVDRFERLCGHMLAQPGARSLRIAAPPVFTEAFAGDLPGGNDPSADCGARRARFRRVTVGEDTRNRRHFHLDVDAVENVARKPCEIALPFALAACAPFAGAVGHAAWARVGRHHQLE